MQSLGYDHVRKQAEMGINTDSTETCIFGGTTMTQAVKT
jgi:hypothetical protein